MQTEKTILATLLTLSLVACGPESADTGWTDPGGKGDTGWVSSTTYEMDAVLAATVSHAATGEYAELASDRELQERLIETQLKYAKNGMKKKGHHLDQLAEAIEIVAVEEDEEGVVTVRYQASIDLTALRDGEQLPALDEVDEPYSVSLPLDPVGVMARVGERCAADWDPYVLSEYKYYYYFAPKNEACDLELQQATVAITKVHEQKKAFPEYDKLLLDLGDDGRGFTVALFASEGHDTIEDWLDSWGAVKDEEEHDGFQRFRLSGDGVVALIDLYPDWSLTTRIRSALGSYQVVLYHGHSSYGTKPFFTDSSAFSNKDYQIISMNSCRSYSYYARQIMEQKATPQDPRGWAATDVVVNVESGWVTYSALAFKPLLQRLLAGVEAVAKGEPEKAADWLTIIAEMDARDGGVLYGAAGVSDNRWHPPQD